MRTFSEASLLHNSNDLLDAATRAPVAITRDDETQFVVMSEDHYKALIEGAGRQRAVEVANMPDHLGTLLDIGLADYFKERSQHT